MSLDKAHQVEDDLKKLRDSAFKNLTADMRKQLDDLAKRAPTLWAEAFGSIHEVAGDSYKLAALVTALKSKLPDVPSDLKQVVTQSVNEAQRATADLSVTVVGDTASPRLTIRPAVTDAINAMAVNASASLDTSRSLLSVMAEGDTFTDLLGALASARGSVNSIEAGTSWAMQTGATDAAVAVADQANVGWVIVGERNACLDCNEYIGQTDADGVDTPPYHPHCFCVIQPWSPDWTDGTSFPDALKREAQRSIARGQSDYDSNKARVQAAGQLLKTGTSLPKSVQTFARTAIKRGNFSNPPNRKARP